MIPSALPRFFAVIHGASRRFFWDDCFSRAAALAYTTLFALVPVTYFALASLGNFGLSVDQVGETLRAILEQLLPSLENEALKEFQGQIFFYLEKFTSNIRALNFISIGVFFCSGIALFNTIERALNAVWRVTSDLALITRIGSFGAVMTLGPFLIAMSIYLTTKFSNLAETVQWNNSNLVNIIAFLSPIIASWVALALLYFKLPAARVRFRDAAFGALIASVMFEVVKLGFAYYVSLSSTYSKLYGVLATIPLFLLWLYVVWVVVLFGAEITYLSGNITVLRSIKKYATDLGQVGAVLGLSILCSITRRFVKGEELPTESQLSIDTGANPILLRNCLDILAEDKIITQADEETHIRTLLISPSKLTVQHVINAFMSSSFRKDSEQESDSKASEESEDLLDMFYRTSQNVSNTNPSRWTLAQLVGDSGT